MNFQALLTLSIMTMRQEKPHASFMQGAPVPNRVPKRVKWRWQKSQQTFLPQGARYLQGAPRSARYPQGALVHGRVLQGAPMCTRNPHGAPVSVGYLKRRKRKQLNLQTSFAEGARFPQEAHMPQKPQQTFLPQGARYLQGAPRSARSPQGALVHGKGAPMWTRSPHGVPQNLQTSFAEGARFPQGAPMPAGSRQGGKWRQQKPRASVLQGVPVHTRPPQKAKRRQLKSQASYQGTRYPQGAPIPAGFQQKIKWMQKPQTSFLQGARFPKGTFMPAGSQQKRIPEPPQEHQLVHLVSHFNSYIHSKDLQRAPTSASFTQEQSSQCSRKRPCPWSTEDLVSPSSLQFPYIFRFI
uniref:Uncharacterized protein n=1 Tax=Cyprinus carpio TaxID=7962 RepID=A0A8C2HQW1_CYPCA